MKYPTNINIVIYFFLILTLNLNGELIAQSTKSPKEKQINLNIRQIDFISRLDFDLRRDRDIYHGWYIIYGAYGGAGTSPDVMQQVIRAGLRDPTNLLAVIREWRRVFSYNDYGSNETLSAIGLKDNVFFSLTHEECLDLLRMEDEDVRSLAKKYAAYLKGIDEDNQKKRNKLEKQLKKMPKY
jgi:hypothetical protein